MKRHTIVVLALSLVGAAAGEGRLLNVVEGQRLVDAVLRELPERLDITYVKTLRDMSRDRADLEKGYTDAFSKLHGRPEDMSAAQLEQFHLTVRMNVEHNLKEQEVGRKSKVRLRYETDRQRVDSFTLGKGRSGEGEEGKEVDVFVPVASTIEAADCEGVWTRTTYSHRDKTARAEPIRGRSTHPVSDLMQIFGLPGVHAGIRLELFDIDSSGVLTANAGRIEQLRRGELERVGVTIRDKAGSAVEITIVRRDPEGRIFLQVVIVCDRADYSKVYSWQWSTGAGVVMVRGIREFDSEGLPRSVSVDAYKPDGSLLRHEAYQVEAVSLKGPVGADAFEPAFAKEYPVYGSAEERKEIEVARLKKQLADSNAGQRLMALAMLQRSGREA